MTTDLYRFYDSSGALLYVGISLSAAARAAQHRAEKSWWPDVARMDVERHPNRGAAAEAERRAIKDEKPIHNIIHNNKTVPAARIETIVKVGEVVALGLATGKCPVGLVNTVDAEAIVLDLYSFFTGEFGHEERRVPTIHVWEVRRARPLTALQRSRLGYRRDAGCVYDMDPLADYQSQYQWWDRSGRAS